MQEDHSVLQWGDDELSDLAVPEADCILAHFSELAVKIQPLTEPTNSIKPAIVLVFETNTRLTKFCNMIGLPPDAKYTPRP